MREFVIENGIVIDDVDSVVEGIRKIADRNHRHIESEQEYLIMMSNGESSYSEIESLINALGVTFTDPIEEPEEVIEESATPKDPEPGFDMSFREKEITIGLLLDTIDGMQGYINELLGELKKSNEDKTKLRELEQKTKTSNRPLLISAISITPTTRRTLRQKR